MSRLNKVNKDHYTMAGRLAPDDLARERMRQMPATRRRQREKAAPPWMTRPSAAAEPGPAGDVSQPVPAKSPAARAPAPPAAVAKKAAVKKAAAKKPAAKNVAAKRPVRKVGKVRKPVLAKASTTTSATKKAPRARGSAARSASPARQSKPAARVGRAKGTASTRQKQKKTTKTR